MQMSDDEFTVWCDKLQLNIEARALISRIRSSPPSRTVQGGRHNMRGQYASTKNAFTVQVESGSGEFLVAVLKNYDAHTIEYYDQPEAIKLTYQAKNDRKVGVRHTPDFFCLEQGRVGWEEWKPEEELCRLAEAMPNRYVRDEHGRWRCPPGETYAAPFQLFYAVHSYDEISTILFQNLLFLADYLGEKTLIVAELVEREIKQCIADSPGLSLLQLAEHLTTATRDDLNTLMAQGRIYVDLSAAPLTKPGYVHVFLDQPTGEAYRTMLSCQDQIPSPPMIELTVGARIIWDNVPWHIANVGETQISLLGASRQVLHLQYDYFRTLVRTGMILGASSGAEATMSDGDRRIHEAPIEALKEANYRWDLVRLYRQYRDPMSAEGDDGERIAMAADEFHHDLTSLAKKHGRATQPAIRTLRHYDLLARDGERLFGNGWINLLSRRHLRGGREPRLDPASLALMDKVINERWLTGVKRKAWVTWGDYSSECIKQGLPAACYKTFCRRIKEKRSEEDRDRAREGKGAGYQAQGPVIRPKREIPRHGTYPWERAHIDHTPVSLPLVCSETGQELQTAWMSSMILSHPRRIVANLVMFRAPSEVTNLMLCRICVWRYQRLPQILITDNGSDFEGTSFQTFMARYKMSHLFRPAGEPRFGSLMEKFFGTSQTQFIHNLPGNTQTGRGHGTRPQERCLVKTLGDLYVATGRYAYDVYDTLQHSELGMSPREAYDRGMANAGDRIHTLIPYDETFRMLSLPFIGRTGKVHVWPGKGFRHQYKNYWADEFRLPTIENTDVEARDDPFDQGHAMAHVQGRWVECLNSCYTQFRGRSAAECVMAAEEWRRRRRQYGKQAPLNAVELARFLRTLEEEPPFTAKMRAHAEDRKLATAINTNPEFFRQLEASLPAPPVHPPSPATIRLNDTGANGQSKGTGGAQVGPSETIQKADDLQSEHPTDHGEF